MSWLVRLYPRAWRKRYGAELETLVHETPGRVGVALDLMVGAAIAYRDVIRANRVLSAAGAYLHGLCVVVLVQGIVFLSLVFAGQRSASPTDFAIGPMDFVTYQPPDLRYEFRSLIASLRLPTLGTFATEVVLFAILAGTLIAVLALPRLVRSLR